MTTTRFCPAALLAARARAGKTVEEAAVAAGCSGPTVRNWERGSSEPPASQLAALAALYGVDIESLFTAHTEGS